jgi:spore coat protein U-like protein
MRKRPHAVGYASGRRVVTRICSCLVLFLFNVGAALATATCTIGVTILSFGTYDVFSGTANDSTGTITVTCTQQSAPVRNLPVTVSLTTGVSGSYATRTMKSGANTLNYNMYAESTRTTIFGDGTAGTSTIGGTFGFTAVGQQLTGTGTIYGRVPAGQDVVAGSYSDTITATVTF